MILAKYPPSLCVSKLEVDHRLLDLQVVRNLRTIPPSFLWLLLCVTLPQPGEENSEIRRALGLHEAQIPDRTKGCEKQSFILLFVSPLGCKTEIWFGGSKSQNPKETGTGSFRGVGEG